MVGYNERFETQKQAMELREATEEGKKALALTEEVLKGLNRAENWGVWDAFGGGLISAMMKYDKLDGVKKKIEELQVQLRKFHTELADVSVEADIRIEISEMLRFADYFFDGVFADLSVMRRIGDARKQAESTKEKITEVLQRLEYMTEGN